MYLVGTYTSTVHIQPQKLINTDQKAYTNIDNKNSIVIFLTDSSGWRSVISTYKKSIIASNS